MKHSISEPIYNSSVTVHVCPWEDYRAYVLKRYGVNGGDNSDALGVCSTFGRHAHIWLKRFDYKNIQDVVTLSHECLHYVLDTTRYVGVLPDNENHEFLTYFHDFAFRGLLEGLKKKSNNKKKNGNKQI